MPRARTRLTGLALCAAIPLAAVDGQSRVETSLSVVGGAATDARGTRAAATTVSPTLVLASGPRARLALSGAGTRFAGPGWALGGSGALALRQPLGSRVTLAADGSGARTTTSFDARFDAQAGTASVELTALATRPVALTVFGGATRAAGATRVRVRTAAAPTSPPALPGIGGAPATQATSTTVHVARAAAGGVGGAVLAVMAGASPVVLVYRESRLRIEGVDVADRTLAATHVAGPLTLTGTVGVRRARDERPTFGSAALAWRVGRGLAVQGALGAYPSDRMAGTLGGRFASAGLVLSAARVAAPSPTASPRAGPGRDLPAPAPGTTRVVLHAPRAARVAVAGDWNAWRPVPATRAPDGTWWLDVRVPRGEYRYAFRVDDARWVTPDDAPTVDDGFGGRSALLTVR